MNLSTAPLLATERARELFVEPNGFSTVFAFCRSGRNVLVIAERGGGKTSLLHALELRLSARPDGARNVAYVDLSAAEDSSGALSQIFASLEGASGSPFDEVALALAGRTLLQRRLERLEAATPTLILGDGLAGTVAYDLFGKLRDRLWDTGHQFVFATDANQALEYTRPPADAFWEQTVTTSFDQPLMKEILKRRAPNGLPPWGLDSIKIANGNPREMLRSAQRFEAGVDSPSAAAERSEDWTRRSAELPRAESMVLAELEGLGSASASDPELLRRVGYSRASVARALRSLYDAELVVAEERSDGPGRPRVIYTPRNP